MGADGPNATMKLSGIGPVLPTVGAIVGLVSGTLTILIAAVQGYRHVQRRQQATSVPATELASQKAVTTGTLRPWIDQEAERNPGSPMTARNSRVRAKPL